MKAIAVYPGKAGSVHLKRVKKPKIKDDEVLVKVVSAGVCGTDIEINQGLYGEAPSGSDYLIIGHESVGEIVELGIHAYPEHAHLNDDENKILSKMFGPGMHVVRTVRRSCGNCINCESGANDMCYTGNFTEIGIKGIHGVMAEYYADKLENLVVVPWEFKDIAVLLEPMSIVSKGIIHAEMLQDRHRWDVKKALVIGAGSIGLLAAMKLRLSGIETYVMARSKQGNLKSRIAESCGAKYFSCEGLSMEGIKAKVGGNIDFIMEASGNAEMAFSSMGILGTNGVLCLTSITGGNKSMSIDANKLNLEMVLGNKCVFGTVNANKADYADGMQYLIQMEKKWPGLAGKLITGNFRPEDYNDAFNKDSNTIKSVIEF